MLNTQVLELDQYRLKIPLMYHSVQQWTDLEDKQSEGRADKSQRDRYDGERRRVLFHRKQSTITILVHKYVIGLMEISKIGLGSTEYILWYSADSASQQRGIVVPIDKCNLESDTGDHLCSDNCILDRSSLLRAARRGFAMTKTVIHILLVEKRRLVSINISFTTEACHGSANRRISLAIHITLWPALTLSVCLAYGPIFHSACFFSTRSTILPILIDK